MPTSTIHPAPSSSDTFTAVRSFALVVVVLWHWMFATIRWDANGPHAGNPLHLVRGGFMLTWILQVMPLFFVVGGMASIGSFERHRSQGRRPQDWVHKRTKRLVLPVLPLVAAICVVKLFASPWLFGLVLLAVSPLWFLAVYVPLTLLTPFLAWAHRRAPLHSLGLSVGIVIALQYVRFAMNLGGLSICLASFVAVWGTVFQLGFFASRCVASRRMSIAAASAGLLGLAAGPISGYSLSMVTTVHDVRSNMGPPTIQVIFLALLQIGLLGLNWRRITQLTNRRRVRAAARWIDARQMTIYASHLPIWVAVLAALRTTPLALPNTATAGWILARPVWLVVPGFLLYTLAGRRSTR